MKIEFVDLFKIILDPFTGSRKSREKPEKIQIFKQTGLLLALEVAYFLNSA